MSTSSEWAVAMCLMLFFVTFVVDFRKIMLRMPTVQLYIDHEVFTSIGETCGVSGDTYFSQRVSQEPLALQI